MTQDVLIERAMKSSQAAFAALQEVATTSNAPKDLWSAVVEKWETAHVDLALAVRVMRGTKSR